MREHPADVARFKGWLWTRNRFCVLFGPGGTTGEPMIFQQHGKLTEDQQDNKSGGGRNYPLPPAHKLHRLLCMRSSSDREGKDIVTHEGQNEVFRVFCDDGALPLPQQSIGLGRKSSLCSPPKVR